MDKIINILKEKIKIIKSSNFNGDTLEIDSLFLDEYDKLLKKMNVNSLDEIDSKKYNAELKEMQALVKQINEFEKNRYEKPRKKVMNKRMLNQYKKNTKK